MPVRTASTTRMVLVSPSQFLRRVGTPSLVDLKGQRQTMTSFPLAASQLTRRSSEYSHSHFSRSVRCSWVLTAQVLQGLFTLRLGASHRHGPPRWPARGHLWLPRSMSFK